MASHQDLQVFTENNMKFMIVMVLFILVLGILWLIFIPLHDMVFYLLIGPHLKFVS